MKNFIFGTLLTIIFLIIFSGFALSAVPDSGEIDATSGWNGSLANNPNNNTWLVVSQSAWNSSSSGGIQGIIISNDGTKIFGPFRIDPRQGGPLAPRVAFAKNENKYLVAWVNAPTNSTQLYGRFIKANGDFDGDTFLISSQTAGINEIKYDSRNKKFVMVWSFNQGGNPAIVHSYLVTVGTDKKVSPVIKLTENDLVWHLSASVALNEDKNEYCVAYDYNANNPTSNIGIRRVDSKNLSLGTETFAVINKYAMGPQIEYNSSDKKYALIWAGDNYSTKGKILNSCNGTDGEEEVLVQEKVARSSFAYNSKSNTFGIIGQDCCSFSDVYTITDTSWNNIDQGRIFTDSRNGKGGNYAPVIEPDTTTGTYAVTSSVDYATTRFVSNVASAVLDGRTYGSGTPFGTTVKNSPPTEGLPTNLGELIQRIFGWALSILGIAVFMIFFYSGFLYLTAAGNTTKTTEAKSHMTNAVFGSILLLSSYLILYTINPNFVKNTFNLPGIGTTSDKTGETGGAGGTGKCADPKNGTADYEGDLSDAIDAVLDANSEGIADELNTTENGFKFLEFVAEELRNSGFEATVRVLNGNDNPNTGDIIAVWRSGDSTMERYDALIGGGEGTTPIGDTTATQYTGDIPLSCEF